MRPFVALRFFALTVVVLSCIGPTRMSAQIVEAGIARDAKLNMPLECLHVALLDSAGRPVAHTVTDSAGRFELEAPTRGVYRMQFHVYGWEALAGPIDTLTEGSFKQRSYPLAFADILLPDTTFDRPPNELNRGQVLERRARFEAYLRRYEADGTWRSRRVTPRGIEFYYPGNLRTAGIQGSVLAYFIVDSTGRARPGSWHPLSVTHPDFEKAVRSALPQSRWQPAQNGGHASCELTLDFTRFYLKDGIAHVVLQTR